MGHFSVEIIVPPGSLLSGNQHYRFDSSGCVRIQDVRGLVAWLLRDTPGQTREQVEAQFRSYERLDVKLATPVAVRWVYVTAWATEDGIVRFRDDIYNMDALEDVGRAAL